MSKAILSSLQGQYFWWLSIFMDSKLQPVQLYGFSKSRLYEPLDTAIFFRNRFCPVSWILLFLPVHFYGYSLYAMHPCWSNTFATTYIFLSPIGVHLQFLQTFQKLLLGFDHACSIFLIQFLPDFRALVFVDVLMAPEVEVIIFTAP